MVNTKIRKIQKEIKDHLKKMENYICNVNIVNIKEGNYCEDLFYWRAKLKQPVNISVNGVSEEYTHVIFTPYKIDKKIREVAIKNTKPDRPDYDSKTGNTHPDIFDSIVWSNRPVIRQIILVHIMPSRQYGPKFVQMICLGIDHVDVFEIVPKICYYPLVDETDNEKYVMTEAYSRLKEIWDCLGEYSTP